MRKQKSRLSMRKAPAKYFECCRLSLHARCVRQHCLQSARDQKRYASPTFVEDNQVDLPGTFGLVEASGHSLPQIQAIAKPYANH